MDKKELKELILSEEKKGNIVFVNVEGLAIAPLADFIKQPVEGLLYDLNRNRATVLTFMDDPKWINDYAVAQVIQALKEQITSTPNTGGLEGE